MSALSLEPFDVLLDRAAAPEPARLPAALREPYGGDLSFPDPGDRPYVIANFVSTVDGVVTYSRTGDASGGGHISGFHRHDRFLMGLLRACADAVVIGAATLHGHPGHVRTPGAIFPDAADLYAGLRDALGERTPDPLNVIVSGRGRVDTGEATFHTPGLESLIVTSEPGAARLREAAAGPASAAADPDASGRAGPRVRTAGPDATLSASSILRLLYEEFGVRRLLHEGGPQLFGSFVAEGLVDELFLTIAPKIAGRAPDEPRPALVEGVAFQPETSPGLELVSVRRSADHLFLRLRQA